MESRREFLQTIAATTAAGLVAADGVVNTNSVAAAQGDGVQAVPVVHPPEPPQGRLKDFWAGTVKELVSIPMPNLKPGEIERHSIYCGMLSGLLTHYWNGNKRGKNGTYPWRKKQALPNGQYQGGDYLGHNIACLAVDGTGEVIDFDFNHNEIFNSSVEHAESRLVRRIFSLAQLNNGWKVKGFMAPGVATSYSNILADVTIYTSLESCSQCSGIMALGSVKEVVFLQRDPGQNSIGNILRQLSPENSTFKAPLPIPADALGFAGFKKLSDAYDEFVKGVKDVPSQAFFIPNSGTPDTSSSITSFLCNDAALDIFAQAKKEFDALGVLTVPDYVPLNASGMPIPKALTNQEVLAHTRAFLAYAVTEGKRGTPHQL